MGFTNLKSAAAKTVALGAGFSSPVFDKGAAPGLSFQLNTLTGSTNAGALALLGSNDGVNFVAISGATASVISGAGSYMVNVSENYMRYIQAVYTQSSGAGNATWAANWPKGI